MFVLHTGVGWEDLPQKWARLGDALSRKRADQWRRSLNERCCVVEQSFAQLHLIRRLAVRWERRLGIHDGFVSLVCVLTCFAD